MQLLERIETKLGADARCSSSRSLAGFPRCTTLKSRKKRKHNFGTNDSRYAFLGSFAAARTKGRERVAGAAVHNRRLNL